MDEKAGSFGGVFPAICSTFAPDGALDLEAQRAVVRFVLSCGADGIVCFGLAGEVNKLTPEERKLLTSTIVEEVDGRVPVLIGAGAEALFTSQDLARHAEAEGAAGIVIPPPITSHLTEAGLAPYFRGIAESVDLPVVIQDAPAYLGINLSAKGIRKLAEQQPNIKYVKLETGPEQTARWVAELAPVMQVFTGNAGMFLVEDIRSGVVGNVPGTEITDLLVAIYKEEKQGRCARAEELYNRLLPYLTFSLQSIDHYNACTKEVLRLRGVLEQGALRLPGPVLDDAALDLLDRLAGDLGLVASTSGARQEIRRAK